MKIKAYTFLAAASTLGCLAYLSYSAISPVKIASDKLAGSKAVLVKGKLPEKYIWHAFTRSGIEHFEKFASHTYVCPAGVRTIGYGFTDKKLVNRNSLNQYEARVILDRKLDAHCSIVKKHVKVKLTTPQLYALASFTYNCGVGNLQQLVNGKGRLNSGNYDSVAKLMPKYRVGGGKILKGLERRRAWEVELWQQG